MSRSFGSSAKGLLAIGALGAAALVTNVANASSCSAPPSFNAPGVSPAGMPDFRNANVNLTLTGTTGKGFTLTATATGGGTFCLGTNSYSISSETFKATALFSSSGVFESGSESISGYIPGLTTTTVQNLYTDSFTGYGVSTSTAGLGFESASDPTGWASKYQAGPESLYLYGLLTKLISNDLSAGLSCGAHCTKSIAISISPVSALVTVPLPASVWLLAAGLVGLMVVRRGRRDETAFDLNAAHV